MARFKDQHARSPRVVGPGAAQAAIGRKLGLHQATVSKLVNAATAEELTAKTLQRSHLVDPYTGYLHRRWNEGIRNATQLFREIQQLGYPGGELAVQRHLRRYRTHRGHMPAPGPKPPSIREVTAWITTHPDHLDGLDTDKLTVLRSRNKDLDRLTRHVRAFAVMLTHREGGNASTSGSIPSRPTASPRSRPSPATRLPPGDIRPRPQRH